MPKAKRTDSRLWRGEQLAQTHEASEHRKTLHWLIDGAEPWASCQVRIKAGPRKGKVCDTDLVEVIRPLNVHLGRQTSKTAAVKLTAQAKVEIDMGTFVAPSAGKDMVSDMLQDWLAEHRVHVRSNTFRTDEIAVRRHLLPRVANLTLAQMTPAQCKAILRAMYDEAGGKLTSTQVKVRRILNALLSDAVREQKLTRNPLDGYRPPAKLTHRSARITAWTPEMQLRFFSSPTVVEDPHRVVYMTAAYTGLRDSEVCGLRRADVVLSGDRTHDDHLDGDKPHLDVRQTRVRIENGVQTGEVKTANSRREVPIAPTLERELRAYRAGQKVPQLDGFLFVDEFGQPLGPDALSKRFGHRVKEFVADNPDVPRIGLHGLRHSFATTLFKRRVDALTVSRLLGHASTSFTMDTYGHLLPDAARDAVADIEAAFGGGPA